MQTTIIGRLTADATIGNTNGKRQVVNFTIAQNDRFKKKGSDEVRKLTTFYDCAYWIGTGIAEHLRKGGLVEITGRISSKAWQNKDGELKSGLTVRVSNIKLHGKAGEPAASSTKNSLNTTAAMAGDDLPF